MRIVFDFHGKDPQVGGSGDLYSNSIIKPPEWPGFSVSLVISDCTQPKDGKPFEDGDCIHWDGNGESIKKALKDALSVVNSIETFAREGFARRLQRTVLCSTCGCYLELKENGKLPSHHAVLSGGHICPQGESNV